MSHYRYAGETSFQLGTSIRIYLTSLLHYNLISTGTIILNILFGLRSPREKLKTNINLQHDINERLIIHSMCVCMYTYLSIQYKILRHKYIALVFLSFILIFSKCKLCFEDLFYVRPFNLCIILHFYYKPVWFCIFDFFYFNSS